MDSIINIETKIAYLEDTINTLNEVIVNQQKKIDRLEDRQNQLIDKLKEVKEMLPSSEKGQEKPPHY